MSKSQLHAFIDRARSDEQFRSRLSSMNPKQIIDLPQRVALIFQMRSKGDLSIDGKEYIFAPKPLKLESYVLD